MNPNKPVYPIDACQPVRTIDIRKPFFVDYWRHATSFAILLFSLVSVNTSAFNRIILYLIIFINIHMTYLIFPQF